MAITLNGWIERLHKGAFANLGGARKSIGKAKFAPQDRDRALEAAVRYFSEAAVLKIESKLPGKVEGKVPVTREQSVVIELDAQRQAMDLVQTVHTAAESLKWLKEVYPKLQTDDAQMILDQLLVPALSVLGGVLSIEALPTVTPLYPRPEKPEPPAEPVKRPGSNGKSRFNFDDLAPGGGVS